MWIKHFIRFCFFACWKWVVAVQSELKLLNKKIELVLEHYIIIF